MALAPRRTPRARLGLAGLVALAALATLGGCGADAPAPRPPAASSSASAPAGAPTALRELPAREDGRLPVGVAPLRYQLALRVDPREPRFSGTATIEVRVATSTWSMVLHGRNVRVASVSARAAGRTIGGKATPRLSAAARGEPDELVLAFDEPLPVGDATLVLAYDAPFDESLSGLYRMREGEHEYAFTQFEPTDARRAFPCFDEPGFKVPFALAVEVPRGMIAVANTRETGRKDATEGWTTFTFAETPPLPTYLVALGVGPLEMRESAGLRLVATKGKTKDGGLALATSAGVLRELEGWFGIKYPYDKLDVVAVPDFSAGAMENPGFVTFREELLIVDERGATTTERRRMAAVIAHELAHQWFGNLVTARWWDDLWLNEGFATWMEAKAVDLWQPSFGAVAEAVRDKVDVMDLDVLPSARAVRQPVKSNSDALEAFDGVTYSKGAAVLSMLEGLMGEAQFRAGVRAYLTAHQHGSATADDLMAALGKASGRDIPSIARGFLDQTGVPLVHAELSCAAGQKPRVHLEQRPMRARAGGPAPAPRRWNVPVCVAYGERALHDPRREQCVVLSEASADLTLDTDVCPTWLLPNAKERGYYRSALADADAKKLEKAGLPALGAEERVGLLAGAWALLSAGETSIASTVSLLRAFHGEQRRIVVEAVVDLLGRLDEITPEADRPAFEKLVRDLLHPIVARLGWSPDPRAKKECARCSTASTDDDNLLRTAALEALATLGNDRVVQRAARERADLFLRGDKDVSPENGQLALRIAAHHGDRALFDAIEKRVFASTASTDRTAAVTALASFDDPALLRRALELATTEKLRLSDLRYLLPTAFRPRTEKLAFAWLEGRWDAVEKRVPRAALGRVVGIASRTCSSEGADRRRAFFAPKTPQLEGTDRDLAIAIERTLACADVREREGGRVRAALGAR